MKKNLRVTVQNKIAEFIQRDGVIVCGNNDYQIVFTFDLEWGNYPKKTARFIVNGKYYDVEFEGNECDVPIISGATEVTVGVYAGELKTTTPARIPCKKSILCETSEATEGLAKDYVDEALHIIENAGTEAVETVREAALEAVGELGVVQSTGNSETAVMSQKAATEAFMTPAEAESRFANALGGTVSGEIVHLEGVSTTQQSLVVKVGGVADPTKVTVTRSGKNLVRTYRYDSSFNYLGITAVINEDGSITFNGTATGLLSYEFIVHNRNGFSLPRGNCVFGLGTSLPNGCRIVAKEYINGVAGLEFMVANAPNSYGVAYLDHSIQSFTWYIDIPSGTTLNSFTVYPQIEYGVVPTGYEKSNYQTLTPNAEGMVDNVFYTPPVTIISTDTEGAILEVKYSLDTNKVIEDINEKINKTANDLEENANEVNAQLQEVEASLSSFANAIKATATGEVIQINDASPLKRINAKVRGVADPTKVTVTRSGKNLVKTYRFPSFNYQGITAVANEDGSITLNGSATADGLVYTIIEHSQNSFSLPSGDYVFSLGASLPAGCSSKVEEYKNGSKVIEILASHSPSNYGIVSIDHRIEAFTWYISIPRGITLNNFTIYPQIELGNEASEFEKPNYQNFTPKADGTIDSLVATSHTTTIYSDTESAVFDIEYNVDTTEVIKKLDAQISDVANNANESVQELGEQIQEEIEVVASSVNAIKATTSGEVVLLQDIPASGQSIKAKVTCPDDVSPTTVTVTRCGKNLVRTYRYDSSYNYLGLTAVNNEDGSITFNGTATGDIWYEVVHQGRNSFSLPSGNYMISLGISLPAGCYSSIFEYDHGTKVVELLKINESNSYGALFIDHSIHSFAWFVYFPSGMTLNNFTVYPQIELGNEASAFEKPNYQTFTPNADGTVDGITSVYPVTTIYSDTKGVVFDVEYNIEAQSGIENTTNNKSANALKTIAKNSFIYADRISPLKHKVNVKVSGVADPTSVRVTKCGKNLIPFPYGEGTKTAKGITFTVNDDGSITVNGRASVEQAFHIYSNTSPRIVLNGNYTISLVGSSSDIYMVVGYSDGTTASNRSDAGIKITKEVTYIRLFAPANITYNNAKVYPMIEVGATATEYEKGEHISYIPNEKGEIYGIDTVENMSIYTNTDGAFLEVEYNTDLNKAIKGFPYAEYSLPIVYLEGDIRKMTKDDKVTLAYRYGEMSGTCTLKWQGSSSIAYPKKNFTVTFDKKFEAFEGWGEQKKYCLKADWIDASHLRNVISAKLWGDVVRSRATNTLQTRLSVLPNCGAIDGFPCFVVINGEWQGIYNFNIPKEDYMFGMGDGTREVILCGSTACPGSQFKTEAILDTLAGADDTAAFDLEYSSDAFADEDVQTSLNRLINACINSNGSDIDTTIAQYLDINSAIDYFIFTVLVKGGDIMDKNQILATYDGTKWFMSAYDLDTTFGQNWNGSAFLPSAYEGYISNYDNVSFATFANFHRLMELLYKYKRADVIARYKELREGVMSLSSVATKFYNYAGIIPIGAHIAEQDLWKEIPLASVKNVAQIVAWYQDRLNQVDKEIAALEETL